MTDRNAVSIPPVSPEAITAALADATGAGDAALRSAFERLCPSPLSPPAEFYAAARAMPNVPVCDLMRQPLPVAISTIAVGMSAPRAAPELPSAPALVNTWADLVGLVSATITMKAGGSAPVRHQIAFDGATAVVAAA